MSDRDGLLSSIEAARLLGVSEGSIHKWRRAGMLAVADTRPGGARRFDPDEIERFRQSRTVGHGPECPMSTDPFAQYAHECHCVSCHCPAHNPTGFLGTCAHCGRPLVVDGVTVRCPPAKDAVA